MVSKPAPFPPGYLAAAIANRRQTSAYPLDDPQEISPQDREATLYMAGFERHIMYLEVAMDEVKALQAVNFDWTLQLDSIWRDSAFHAPGLHEEIRTALIAALANKTQEAAQNPLRRVITGPAGAGKTHLLSALSREVATVPAWFVLVDMTDVRDFWETVLLGYINSLQQKISRDQPQFHYLLGKLFAQQLETRPAPAHYSKNKRIIDLLRSTYQ